MIKHGVKNGESKEHEKEIKEYLEVEAMPESMEKHTRLVLLNPDNYRSWKFIRAKFSGNPKEIEAGLNLTLKSLQANPKSYCAWNSRAFYLAHAQHMLAMEKKLCKQLLLIDPRNFHCWNHCRRFGLKIPLDYTNYSSLHNAWSDPKCGLGRPVENLFTDVEDEAAWAYFFKCDTNLADLRVFMGREYMNIHFSRPFTGIIIYAKQNHVVDVSLLVYRIKIETGVNEKTIELNGAKYKMEKKEEPTQIDAVLKRRPECVYALREKLKYSVEKTKRTEILDKLIRIDSMRKTYYKSLEKKSYEISYVCNRISN